MTILGIETSCDETAAAVVKNGKQILSNIVSSQVNLHKKYWGIVPEVAARAHVQTIIPAINESLKKAKVLPKDIDCIAITKGPGLISSLMIGVDTARSLAYAWNKPIIGINHIEAHIYSNWLKSQISNLKPVKFPSLCLIVSGGHTLLALMKDHGKYKVLGSTRDDAAGEAFDKVAKLLKIGYPGGPIIEKLARQGNAKVFDLPRPMLAEKNFDFSFSGLKTAVIDVVRSQKSKIKSKKFIRDLCASFQKAVVDVLIEKTIRAARKYKVKAVLLCGGVAANKPLRRTLKQRIKKELLHTTCHIPYPKYCTDNAAMIALAGYYHFKRKKFDSWKTLQADANAKLK